MKTLTAVEITRTVSGEPETSGADRQVWFVGDLVVKADWVTTAEPQDRHYYDHPSPNEREVRNYRRFKRRKRVTFEVDGETWTVRFPSMRMVSDYLVAERKDFPHPPEGGECPECPGDDEFGWRHAEDCRIGAVIDAVDEFANVRLGLYDMHEGNFVWDEANREVWIVDLAD